MTQGIDPGYYQIKNAATKKYVTNAGASEGKPVRLSNQQNPMLSVTEVSSGNSVKDSGTTLTIFPGPKQEEVVWGQPGHNYPWTITQVTGDLYTVQEKNSSTAWYDPSCNLKSGCDDFEYIALGDLQQNDHYRWHFTPITV